jgi:hypothetical protein
LVGEQFRGGDTMRSRTTLGTANLLAVGVSLGAPLIPAVAQHENPELSHTPAGVAEQAMHGRAVEAVFWGMPAVIADLQREPWLERDKAVIDQLKTIGIEKGNLFDTDAKTLEVLNDAVGEAHAWLGLKYEGVVSRPFNDGSHWALPASPEVVERLQTNFAKPDAYPVDDRGVSYSIAYFSAKHLSTGQFYLMTIKDKEGRSFEGVSTYRLTVPANAPLKLCCLRRRTTARLTRSSATRHGPVAPPTRRTSTKTLTVQWTYTLGPTLLMARNRTGFRQMPAGSSSSSSVCTARKSRCLIRGGRCRTSRTRSEHPRGEDLVLTTLTAATALLAVACLNVVATEDPKPVLVTAENFQRAESDLYFGNVVKDGGFGRFHHNRELAPIDRQPVIRLNRDTLYSAAVFDLDAGPVTITLPDSGKRFMSLQLIDEDQYCPAVLYGAGKHILTRDQIGTRYIIAAVRTLIDPANPKDLGEVHNLQDAIRVEQKSPGKFEVPDWDHASQKKVRDALLVLGSTLPDSKRMFGPKAEVDPVRHLIGTAMAWGGNPEKDAVYLNVTPASNDGKTVYRLTVKDVPVDAFWSISVYNAQGYFQENNENVYTLNNLTAKKGEDGSITVQFGGSDGKTPNCLPIVPGWNFIVRLYRPRVEVLEGTWKFPQAQPVP